MLSECARSTFVADGTTTEYHLDARNIDGIKEVYAKRVLKINEIDFNYDSETGVFILVTASTEPDTYSQDNEEYTNIKEEDEYADRKLKCVYYVYLIIEYSLVEIKVIQM